MGKRSEQTSHQRRYTDGMDAQYRMSFSSVGNCKLKQQVTTTYILEQAFPGGSDGKESACNAGDPGLIPGSERSPGERNEYPLQYSCLKNSMDKGV